MPLYAARATAAQILVAVLTICCATKSQAQPAQSAAAPSLFHEEVLAEISPGAEVKQILVSAHHLAWAEKQGGKYTVRLDGKPQGESYDEVEHLNFSLDESHLAFFGKRSSEWVFVLDGHPHPSGYTKATAVAFQPEGTGMAYGECRAKKCRLVVDGAESGEECEDISYPQYSRDGKRIAFLAKRSKKWVAVVDGKQMGPELSEVWFSSWGFSGGGGHFFVTGREKNDWFHAVDGAATPGFEALSRIVFSRDDKHYAYGGANAKGGLKKQKIFGAMVKDGQTLATYEGKGMVGQWSLLGGSQEIMVTGVHTLVTDFHGVSTPEFDPDGKLVYAARRDKGDVAVFQGIDAGPGFDEVLSPVIFTKDAQHFAYVARLSGDFVEVRDNKVARTIPAGKRGATEVTWIMISADGAHLAYETISGGANFKAGQTPRALRTAVVDGESGPEYNALAMVNFAFAPDASHYFYEVIGADAKRDLVNVDGHESRLYDSVANARYVTDSKTIEFVARDGSRFLRVSYNLAAGGAPPVSPAAGP